MQVSSRLAGRTTPRSHQPTRLQLPGSSQENRLGAASASPRPSMVHDAGALSTQRLQLVSGSQESRGSFAATSPRLGSAPHAGETARQRLSQNEGGPSMGFASRSESDRPLGAHAEPAQQERSAQGPDEGQGSRGRDQPRMVLGMQTPTARPHGLSSTGANFGKVINFISES